MIIDYASKFLGTTYIYNVACKTKQNQKQNQKKHAPPSSFWQQIYGDDTEMDNGYPCCYHLAAF